MTAQHNPVVQYLDIAVPGLDSHSTMLLQAQQTTVPVPVPITIPRRSTSSLGHDDDDDSPNDSPNHDTAPTPITTSSRPAEPTGLPHSIPDASSSPPGTFDPDGETANNLVNMYFVILAAFAIVLLFGLWYWRRGKMLKRIASAGRRRSALEHDLELGRQRGGWLGGVGRRERQEGVDERGEAPPPYTADGTTTVDVVTDTEVHIPPRAHVREGVGLPKYEELRGSESQSSRSPEGELLEGSAEEVQELDLGHTGDSGPRAEEGGSGATPPVAITPSVRDAAPDSGAIVYDRS